MVQGLGEPTSATEKVEKLPEMQPRSDLTISIDVSPIWSKDELILIFKGIFESILTHPDTERGVY